MLADRPIRPAGALKPSTRRLFIREKRVEPGKPKSGYVHEMFLRRRKLGVNQGLWVHEQIR